MPDSSDRTLSMTSRSNRTLVVEVLLEDVTDAQAEEFTEGIIGELIDLRMRDGLLYSGEIQTARLNP